MFRNVLCSLVTETAGVHRCVSRAPVIQRLTAAAASSASSAPFRSFSDVKDEVQPPFDASLLEFLVCPLSKKPLRYEAKTNELINEELGIAYPIVGGIPNMIPQEARLIQKDTDTSTTPTQG
ncbi:protein preY, mitochondrial-like [Dicentrarchus labrax]|uniref:Protein preY, mitochondrial n=1 Tax=Dicentrarchus labrax TaxID=13489 RepID=A0A8C4NTM0_DICLA|nr:protein preY, mitochondrial-like [Dicentrarchus labrax]